MKKKLTPEDFGITKYTWNPDGSLNVKGNIDLSNKNLKVIPFKFKEVDGWFSCNNNQLTSLEGAPTKVGGGFYCSCNQLTSLEDAPIEVAGDFYCINNQLKSLEGIPRKIGGMFLCYDNPKEFTKEEIKYAMHSTNTIKFIKSIKE